MSNQERGVCCHLIAPVATDWSRTKSWDISLDCHIGKYRRVIRSKIVFFRISSISVPCPHSQLGGRTVNKKLWTFFGPWGRDHSQSPPCWIFRLRQIHPSTASERTTRQCCHVVHLCLEVHLFTPVDPDRSRVPGCPPVLTHSIPFPGAKNKRSNLLTTAPFEPFCTRAS